MPTSMSQDHHYHWRLKGGIYMMHWQNLRDRVSARGRRHGDFAK